MKKFILSYVIEKPEDCFWFFLFHAKKSALIYFKILQLIICVKNKLILQLSISCGVKFSSPQVKGLAYGL
jgi:hypothetical protein